MSRRRTSLKRCSAYSASMTLILVVTTLCVTMLLIFMLLIGSLVNSLMPSQRVLGRTWKQQRGLLETNPAGIIPFQAEMTGLNLIRMRPDSGTACGHLVANLCILKFLE